MTTRLPDSITITYESSTGHISTKHLPIPSGSFDDVSYSLDCEADALHVSVTADTTPLCYIRLNWRFNEEECRTDPVRVMGDAWERGYGDLEWRGIVPERRMQWYFLVSNGTDLNRSYENRRTDCYGVKVRPSSLCSWQYTTAFVTLTMDIRSGARGVVLCGRTLEAGDVLFRTYENCSAYEAGRAFCGEMCTECLTTSRPVYGSNNWYYAYGNSSHEDILRDSKLVAELCAGNDNAPYMVIDDGWSKYSCDGPWTETKASFPDMAGLAEEMKAIGVKPGIWVRYLADAHGECRLPAECHFSHNPSALDPSHPAVLEYVRKTTEMLIGWGYTLIKHDFSTFDIFGKWGFQAHENLADGKWSFHDNTKTSAEIILDLYRAIREAAGPDVVLIGCNTIGHLCAGLVELNRTGDDTSGMEWERTRKMGVNTLAFRMMQNGTFYAADADCVGIMGKFPWSCNKQWLKLLSLSGSPLFVSCKPDVPTESEFADIREGFCVNSVQSDRAVPLDWMESVCPEKWLINGEEVAFRWF